MFTTRRYQVNANFLERANQKLLTIDEAADFLNVKVSRLRSAIFKGDIPYIKLGRLVRFDPKDLIKWIDELKGKTEKIIKKKKDDFWDW